MKNLIVLALLALVGCHTQPLPTAVVSKETPHFIRVRGTIHTNYTKDAWDREEATFYYSVKGEDWEYALDTLHLQISPFLQIARGDGKEFEISGHLYSSKTPEVPLQVIRVDKVEPFDVGAVEQVDEPARVEFINTDEQYKDWLQSANVVVSGEVTDVKDGTLTLKPKGDTWHPLIKPLPSEGTVAETIRVNGAEHQFFGKGQVGVFFLGQISNELTQQGVFRLQHNTKYADAPKILHLASAGKHVAIDPPLGAGGAVAVPPQHEEPPTLPETRPSIKFRLPASFPSREEPTKSGALHDPAASQPADTQPVHLPPGTSMSVSVMVKTTGDMKDLEKAVEGYGKISSFGKVMFQVKPGTTQPSYTVYILNVRTAVPPYVLNELKKANGVVEITHLGTERAKK